MKKILILAVLALPCLPSLIAGVESQKETNETRRDKMLNQRFEAWCNANGYDYYGISENDSETLWVDFWMETEDYQNAVDSIDEVLSVKTAFNQSM